MYEANRCHDCSLLPTQSFVAAEAAPGTPPIVPTAPKAGRPVMSASSPECETAIRFFAALVKDPCEPVERLLSEGVVIEDCPH